MGRLEANSLMVPIGTGKGTGPQLGGVVGKGTRQTGLPGVKDPHSHELGTPGVKYGYGLAAAGR